MNVYDMPRLERILEASTVGLESAVSYTNLDDLDLQVSDLMAGATPGFMNEFYTGDLLW